MYAALTAVRASRQKLSAAAGAALAGTAFFSSTAVLADQQAKQPAGALNPNEFKAFKVTEKEQLTHNTWRVRFQLPDNQVSGLNVASCLVTRATLPDGDASKPVVRPYTPTTPPDAKGYMDLVVKSYPTGKMSRHICELQVGQELEMKGPIPKYPYKPNTKKHIGMVAGGTGITPMLQVIDAVLSNPEDNTTMSLIYANQNPGEIILKEYIDKLAAQHPNRFKVFYVVDKPNWAGVFWKGGVGFITPTLLKEHLPAPDKDNLVMVCGPPGMMQAISGPKAKDFTQGEVSGALKDLGYTTAMVYKF